MLPPRLRVRHDPASLDAHVDWMVWTHQELYDMVHQGVDLAGAAAVADGWARLSQGLHQVADQLTAALLASESGWHGDSADQARQGMRSVTGWATDTGNHAKQVAGAVTDEISHVETARNRMPAPPPAAPHMVPLDGVHRTIPGINIPAGGAGPASDVAYNGMLGTDSAFRRLDNADEQHRQAATVMTEFQQGSLSVEHTVPQFSVPQSPVLNQVAPPPPMPPPASAPPALQPFMAAVPPVAPRPGAGTSTATPRGGAMAGRPEPLAESPRTARGPQSMSGVSATEPAARAAVAQGRATGSGSTGSGAGMAPGGSARGGEDLERRSAPYLEEDEDLFGLDQKYAPPVIGA
ncbi:PPE domain-containing protein [Solihabitans fulvus]|uniref:PPE domain-containing protein n=1 Tax=Solihabitans fulvus TaxID=1892852 RepID=A0A5B2XEM0_9PSEU|nr:PPE domain-containing protein [Solihabitans fulvus]KAA2262177.1 PPE domain-containing protein [Solihabitans fulvus]